MGTIKRNLIYSVIYQLLTIALPLITAPYISRVLGANGVGIFSYTSALVNYFVLAGMLGMTNLGNRCIAEISKDRKKRSEVFWNLYSLQVLSFCVVTLAYILYCLFICDKYNDIAAIQIFYIIGGMLDIGWLFFGLEEIKITVVRNLMIKMFTIVCVFLFVKENGDVFKYAAIMSIGTFLSQIYLWASIKKYIDFVKPEYGSAKEYIRQLFVYFIPVIAYSIYKLMDKVMLGIMCPINEVGYYENAVKIVNVPMGIINGIGTVMLPRITSMRAEGKEEKAKLFTAISIELVTFIASAICFGLMSVSKVFAVVFYGEEFIKSGTLISMLSCTCLFIAWSNVTRTQYLIPYNKDAVYVGSTVVGAIINLLVNSVLIPKYAGKGAALGTIVAEFSVMIYQIIAIRKEIHIGLYIKNAAPYLINGCIMLVLVCYIANYLGSDLESLIIQILFGGFVYIFLGKR